MADVKKVLQVTGNQIDKALLPIARERYNGRYAQSDGQGGLKFVDGSGGGDVTKQYVDQRDNAILASAKQYTDTHGGGGGGIGTNDIFVVNFVVSGENVTSDKTSTEVIDAYNQKKVCIGMLKDGGYNRMLTLTEIDTRYNAVFFGVVNYDGDSLYSNYIYLIENDAVRYTPSFVTSVNSGTRGQFAISDGTGGLDFITLQNASEVAL